MANDPDYVGYILELLEPLGDIQAKPMFGGYGIYQDRVMFGLVADNMLYLKVDKNKVSRYEQENLEPFVYERGGRPVVLSYRRAPTAALEDGEMLRGWARGAIDAALARV